EKREAVFLVAVAFDSDARQVGQHRHQLALALARVVRLAVVDGALTKHAAVRAADGRGPAGAQAVGGRQIAVVGPQRVGRDIRDNHRLPPVGGRATGADGRADGNAVDPPVVPGGQAGGGTVAQVYAVAVEQEDRAEHPGRLGLDEAGER